MKKTFIILAIALVPAWASGQVITEIFQQGAAQKKYLIQQIAALNVYIDYARKGYSITQNGLDDIGKIKKGDLEMHTGHYDSLRSVNPKVRSYGKVAAILRMQADILQVYRSATKSLAGSGLFTSEESVYVDGVYRRLMEDCSATVDDLKVVISNGKLQMTDDERIRRIDKIYLEMQYKYCFVQEFSTQSKLLAAARTGDRNEVKNSRVLNGLK